MTASWSRPRRAGERNGDASITPAASASLCVCHARDRAAPAGSTIAFGCRGLILQRRRERRVGPQGPRGPRRAQLLPGRSEAHVLLGCAVEFLGSHEDNGFGRRPLVHVGGERQSSSALVVRQLTDHVNVVTTEDWRPWPAMTADSGRDGSWIVGAMALLVLREQDGADCRSSMRSGQLISAGRVVRRRRWSFADEGR